MQMADHPTHSDRFRDLIRSLTGISLPPSKVMMIDQRLRRRVLAAGLPSTEAYLEKLLGGALPDDELRQVIDLITTNTTSFFREADHFDQLVRTILPERLGHRGAGGAARRRFKLWSAASSEGAEAYTAAMVLEEARRRRGDFDFAILGTDISQRMLERAVAAVYANEQLSTVPRDLVARYFLHSSAPSMAGKSRVVPELRARVRFRHLNLMDASYPVDRDVDVILLRNVLIYFDAGDKEKVVDRLVGHLAPGGYLMVGHAESMVVRHALLRQIRPTIFQKGDA
ncbi:chemotaxis protein CheR [Rhodobacter sp. CCP-1]|uniref:Chemotaxis protein methyltransferase n=2 Tax=Paragemmobacter ruber TaxID=1985673 RepID=A0ABW9Y7S3_9RHOB|nr:chemotaxis protein CheR [Rhodobacter ruber]